MLIKASEITRRGEFLQGAVSPRHLAGITQSHPKWGSLHRDPCRETAHGRMFLPSVLPAVRVFPWPFLKGNTHLQFLGYRSYKMSCSVKHPTASHADGDRGIRAVSCHTWVSDGFWGHTMRRCFTSNREMGTAAHQHEKLLQRDSCGYEEDPV